MFLRLQVNFSVFFKVFRLVGWLVWFVGVFCCCCWDFFCLFCFVGFVSLFVFPPDSKELIKRLKKKKGTKFWGQPGQF